MTLNEINRKILELYNLKDNWIMDTVNGPVKTDHPAPSTWSVDMTVIILDVLTDLEVFPSDIVPHAEGGVTIIFFRQLDFLYIETHNEGTVTISDFGKNDILKFEHPIDVRGVKSVIKSKVEGNGSN